MKERGLEAQDLETSLGHKEALGATMGQARPSLPNRQPTTVSRGLCLFSWINMVGK